MNQDPLLSPGEVARILSVNPRTVARWANQGKLPSIRTPGGHHRFRKSDIEDLLRGHHG